MQPTAPSRESPAALLAGAYRRTGETPRFRFTAQGRIGKIEELKAKTLRISIAADRLAEGRDGQYTKTEWLRCVSFDADLNAEMLTQLDKGDSVTFEGRIVPTVWMKGEQKIYDNTFEITRYQRLSRPKAKSESKTKTDPTAEAAA